MDAVFEQDGELVDIGDHVECVVKAHGFYLADEAIGGELRGEGCDRRRGEICYLIKPSIIREFLSQYWVTGGPTGFLKRQQLIGKYFPLFFQIQKNGRREGIVENINGSKQYLRVGDAEGVGEGVGRSGDVAASVGLFGITIVGAGGVAWLFFG